MELKLEELDYQKAAIHFVIKVFDGTSNNSFDYSISLFSTSQNY
jgi:hypothetical protein